MFRTTSRVSFYLRVAKQGVAAESRKGNLPNFPSPTLHLSPSTNDPISIFDNDIIPNDEFRTILESSSRSDRVSKSRDNESPFNLRSTIRFERRDNMAKNDSLMESLARFFPFSVLFPPFFLFPQRCTRHCLARQTSAIIFDTPATTRVPCPRFHPRRYQSNEGRARGT